MARDIPIGNGTVLAAFDFDYRIRDFYYPRVGKENHALGNPWRLGVWVDGGFAWVERGAWTIARGYVEDSLVTEVDLRHAGMALHIRCNDVVDFEKNLLLRRAVVHDLAGRAREVRLFFHCDLSVMENPIGDTVFFDPRNACLVHYKGPRYFLLGSATRAEFGVTRFATGKKGQPGLEGTWRDAENGSLGGGTIAQGAVDSVIAVHLSLTAGGEDACYHWIAAGRSYQEVEALHRYVTVTTTPDALFERNVAYWRHWLVPREEELCGLPEPWRRAYRRSLLVMRTQIDRGGAILAANDTDIWQFNLDTYSYVWPRDGAIIAQALARAGFSALSRRFLRFCTQRVREFGYSAGLLEESGFLMHKYNPDGSVGSSWHPWIEGDEVRLPIQEDETALVVWAIWSHYAISGDIEAVQGFYWPFVVQAAEFLLAFRDEATGLPLPSYDLWEEQRGVFTFTTATVIAGLRAAARLAQLFEEDERAGRYRAGAEAMRLALERHLYAPDHGRFLRGIVVTADGERRDATVDASLLALCLFDVCAPADPRLTSTVQSIERRLWVEGPIGGIARYEGDSYQAAGDDRGNPWVICTLWLAQYYIAAAEDAAGLRRAARLLDWTVRRAAPSGVLPEQVDPRSGEFLSVSPLTWSHGTLVAALLDYREKARRFGAPSGYPGGPA